MDEEIFCDCGRFRNDDGEKNEEGQLLSEYLIPYFSREDIEREAEDILSALCPEALQKPELISADHITRLLGLTVIHLPFYKREKTQSILFFADGEVVAEDEHGRPYKENVPADTIVLNTNHRGIGFEKNTIFHECFHYIEHQLFFRLQKAASADVSCLPDWTPVRKQDQNDNPIEWMEWQARYGSQCLQMPRSMVRERTNQALQEMRGSFEHDGVKLERIGRSLANRFHVHNYRARNRLIQTGYGAARGLLNDGNNGYIQPFAFSLEECRSGQTFVIRIEDALREYVRNETFRELLDSGRYVYVDGHFCLDEAKYVRHGEKRLYLTRWANAHIDECCLRFLVRYTRDRQNQYNYGQLNSDDEYNERYLTLSLNESSERVMARAQEMSEVLMSLPGSFHGRLKAHMKRCDITIEKLEELAHISERTIKRLRIEERKDYSLDQVIAICLALHLPPEFSLDLIEKAGFVLRKTPEHLIYRVILRTMCMESIDTVQARLRACGCAPLRLGEQGEYERDGIKVPRDGTFSERF